MPHLTAQRRPRRIVARTLGLGLSAIVAAGLLVWTPSATSGWNQGAAEGTLWQLLNGARANNGMAPLQQHGTLVGLARWRSADMLAKNYFSHTIAGCGCLVYTYYDSNGLSYVWGGENIGWNSGLDDNTSAVRVHEAFMASSGHRANVLNRAFTHGGVGAAAADGQMFQGYVQNTRMYTELFLQAPSAPAPAPAPAPATAPAPAPRPASQPAPAPRAPSGGGATAPAPRPAARATAPVAAAEPEPKPKLVAVAAPRRPVSTAGIDGVATTVSTPRATTLATHLRADEIAAVRAASMPTFAKAAPDTIARRVDLEVTAAPPVEANVIEGLVGAVLGFLFG